MTPWIVSHQAPLSMGFSRQEYWSRLPFPSPGDLSNPGIKPASPALADRFFTTEPPVATFFQKKEKSKTAAKCPHYWALPLRSAALQTQVETHLSIKPVALQKKEEKHAPSSTAA